MLACLVEKQRTTPQAYPLTDNALIAACNQSTNREPVVQYDVATVRLAVRSLRERGLVRTVHRTGERTDKHRSELETALGVSPSQAVLLATLLLRGPQTVAELRARSERMHAFASAEEVEAELEVLAGRDDPLVHRLPRAPGRKESRYAALLVPEQAAAAPARVSDDADWAPAPPAPSPPRPALREEVAALHEQVAALREEVAALRQEVEALGDRHGTPGG